MAIKFNVALSIVGIDVPSGALGLIQYTSPFPSYTKVDGVITPVYEGFFTFKIFKDQSTFLADQSNFLKQAFDQLPFSGSFSLTKEEAQNLTAVDVETRVKACCESRLGEYTCEIVDPFA